VNSSTHTNKPSQDVTRHTNINPGPKPEPETEPETEQSFLKSLSQSISKLTRIKLDKANKQRIIFFDLKKGIFVRSGEEVQTNQRLRRAIRKLNQEYFSVMSKKVMVQRLPPHSDMICRHHGYCMTLGRMLDAHWIFAGDLIRFGNSLQVFLRLYDVKTGFIRASEVLKGKTVSDLDALITPSLIFKMLNMEK